jgi:hypothetical protein
MRTKKKLFFILSIMTLVTQSCINIYVSEQGASTSGSGVFKKTVKGNKIIVNKEINISDYAEIYFSIPGKMVYRQTPDKTPYLQITTDENILPLLEIETTTNHLKIRCKNNTNINPSQLIIYTNSSYLSKVEAAGSGTVHLKEEIKSANMNIRISGSGKVVSDDLSCEKIQVAVTGSGKVELRGSGGGEASYTVTGSGNIDISNYPARNVNCRVTGSGNVFVYAEDKLTAEVTGSGNIKYKGNPATNVRVTGSGNIKQIK